MMFPPPPGYVDMLSDAEDYVPDGRWRDLDVPKIGVIPARKPRPAAAAWLAMSAKSDGGPQERVDYLVRFVQCHVDPATMIEIYPRAALGEIPENAVERIARSLSTWGTARPYVAVISLCVMTAHHWRTIRGKLLDSGIADPLTQIPTLHPLLDRTEALLAESAANGEHGEQELHTLYRNLYGPTPAAARLNDDDSATPAIPAGFDPEDVEDAFDAFALAAR